MINKIKRARKVANLTQYEMSQILGIPLSTIKAWDAGQAEPPVWAESLIIDKLEQLQKGAREMIEEIKNSALDWKRWMGSDTELTVDEKERFIDYISSTGVKPYDTWADEQLADLDPYGDKDLDVSDVYGSKYGEIIRQCRDRATE